MGSDAVKMSMITLFALVSCTKTKLDCGDLLAQYAQKPEALEFVDCQSGTGQTLYTAIYQVPGANAEAVERILVDDYGMGKLRFVGYNWEPEKGRYGQYGSQALQNINPNYTMLITMCAHAEDKEKGLIINRNKIPCFYVQVSIVEI